MRLAFLFCLFAVPVASVRAEPFRERVRPLLEKYCFDCHDSPKPKADVDLTTFEAPEHLWRDPKLWERALVQLQDKVMPPPTKKQPSEPERAELIAWLRQTLAQPDEKQLPRDPGPALIHRLSRLEYNHTVRDLLGAESRPADSFPPDAGGGAGFDNTAATLFVPPLLLEKYLSTATKLMREAPKAALFRRSPSEPAGEAAAAQANLFEFAQRAFRRATPAPELARYVKVYEASRAGGISYEESLRAAATAMLISPQFLFRIEPATDSTTAAPVDDFSLASRLSYFLWSSMPDEELFRLAREKKLHEPAILMAQVRRMLKDPKARALAENFAGQWLRVKEVRESVSPAPDRFPQFDRDLREAFYREPIDFFHGLLRENLPLSDCLDCEYTYANEALAKFYGLPGVAGAEMRRVAMPDRRRGGLLGMGGIHALTSYPRRTSPVLRGKWVMEEILGTPPPPPPADVNTQAVDRHEQGKTFRQRLEQHRARPQCAGCHARMDPLGFGLENFGVIGEWRTEADKETVDASGQLVSGEKFNGPIEMKKLLLERKGEFTRNVTEKMLAYALGRALEPADWWPVQQIARATAADGYRLQTLILGVVQSYPFQYRRPSAVHATAQNP